MLTLQETQESALRKDREHAEKYRGKWSTERVLLDSIRLPANHGTAGCDDYTVDQYIECISSGARQCPPTVYREEDGEYRLSQGLERLAAISLLGHTELEVDVYSEGSPMSPLPLRPPHVCCVPNVETYKAYNSCWFCLRYVFHYSAAGAIKCKHMDGPSLYKADAARKKFKPMAAHFAEQNNVTPEVAYDAAFASNHTSAQIKRMKQHLAGIA